MTDESIDGEALVGRVVRQRYRVLSVLGVGGMGVVYEVEHLQSGERYALKTFTPKGEPGSTDRELLVARFKREARAASVLDHPHIVEVFDLGAMAGGTLYLAMELARGSLLTSLIDRRMVGPRRALVIARQVLDALDYAHQRGMVHRDLKPDNIMVTRAGAPGREYDQVKLFDFGLVKLLGETAVELGGEVPLTNAGVAFGTPDYMAPEQALGHPIDGRTDLYALGLVLYEMFTGRNPFYAPSAMEVMHMHVTTPPRPLPEVVGDQPWCTDELQALVVRALAKRPDDRFPDARAMTRALDRAFESLFDLPPES